MGSQCCYFWVLGKMPPGKISTGKLPPSPPIKISSRKIAPRKIALQKIVPYMFCNFYYL